jgi:hypothetical protein
MSDPSPATALRARLDDVAERLERHAASSPARGLTDPDPPTGERWDWGQVWAHLGEFVPYWIREAEGVRQAGTEPVPFGRIKTDPARVAAIEADRDRPVAQLMARLRDQLDGVRGMLGSLSPEDWGRRGVHQTLGVMDLKKILDEFVVGHLEQHADQLDHLVRGTGSPGP